MAWPGAAVWAVAWAAMLLLDGHVELANLALVLVLAAAMAGVWLAPPALMLTSTAAVLAFNFAFVPPRGSFTVNLQQHAWLLLTMLVVSLTIALLMARQRRLVAAERLQSRRAEQLRGLGEWLRDSDEPRAGAPRLQALLTEWTGAPVALRLAADGHEASLLGAPDADERAGLQLSQQQSQAMGPGTGRHEEQPAWYLPLRGRAGSQGAAVLRLPKPPRLPADLAALRLHAQALCDQLGLALERARVAAAAAAARTEAEGQKLRNTLLAAVAHDYRTPLATILGAASALHDQDDRLSAAQRRQLAASIVEEAEALARLTSNSLQLARLDAPGLALQLALDWESAEELVGTVVRRSRRRDPARRIKLRLAPGLPLLRCDAVLMVQLLENLVDNALKYGGSAPVEVLVRRVGQQVLLAVRDRGAGVDPGRRERIFDVFQRGDSVAAGPAARAGGGAAAARDASRGVGIGLAVCRAIARAHGGELRLRARSHGGSSFECWLPLAEPPQPAPDAEA